MNVLLKLLQLALSDLLEELVLLLPADNHSRVNVSSKHLNRSGRVLGAVDHVVELCLYLQVECVLR